MSKTTYYAPHGGHPPQTDLLTDRAMFTEAYAVIPKGVMRDIVTSWLPFWTNTRLWVIARPLSGFAETFSQYIVEVNPGGGSDKPEQDKNAEAVLFVVEGEAELTLQGSKHVLKPGGYAFIPPGADWTLHNVSDAAVRFHWVRKHYQAVDGIPLPEAFVTNEQDVEPIPMPGTNGAWVTTRFVDMSDMRHDMHVNIVTFEPGGVIPFAETHVMEHGLYVLEGKAVYRLNQDWVEVEAGDFMWLRAFCPQACYSGGPGRFRYLLYKGCEPPYEPDAEPRALSAAPAVEYASPPVHAGGLFSWTVRLASCALQTERGRGQRRDLQPCIGRQAVFHQPYGRQARPRENPLQQPAAVELRGVGHARDALLEAHRVDRDVVRGIAEQVRVVERAIAAQPLRVDREPAA